jgi:hypothetical protein
MWAIGLPFAAFAGYRFSELGSASRWAIVGAGIVMFAGVVAYFVRQLHRAKVQPFQTRTRGAATQLAGIATGAAVLFGLRDGGHLVQGIILAGIAAMCFGVGTFPLLRRATGSPPAPTSEERRASYS